MKLGLLWDEVERMKLILGLLYSQAVCPSMEDLSAAALQLPQPPLPAAAAVDDALGRLLSMACRFVGGTLDTGLGQRCCAPVPTPRAERPHQARAPSSQRPEEGQDTSAVQGWAGVHRRTG